MKTEGKRNESVNNEFKIMRKSNSLHQIMKLTHRIHVCLIILLIHYFDIMNSLKSDKTYYILILMNLIHYESISVTWTNVCPVYASKSDK